MTSIADLERENAELRQRLEQAEIEARRYRHLRTIYVRQIVVPSIVRGRDDSDQFDDATDWSIGEDNQ